MPGQHLTAETKRAIQALRQQGFSIRKMAAVLGIGKKTVERQLRELPAGPLAPVTKRDRTAREEALERIIDLSGERLVEVLEGKEKIGPVALNVIMGTAWDKRYAKEPVHTGAQNVILNLFGGNPKIMNLLAPHGAVQVLSDAVNIPAE